ncbi:cell division protein FtsK [Saccharomonospora piscinae]|uniref:Cell division protein FtsK n=2 Tax=Saccharomonospora piscinae TaxID=687388 RepID=A0A1V9A7W5_SACPI|nr:cell division protein FtsK [Saccharomonospora piscinae]
MSMQGSRWIDPAPLEVERPRLPWWTLLPRWAQVVALPFVLMWLVVWLLVQVGRLLWRYPLTLVAAVLVGWVQLATGWWGLAFTLLAVVVVLGVWWRVHLGSFTRSVVVQVRTERRRFGVYACQWRAVMRLSGLVKAHRAKEYRPALGLVRSHGWRDRVRVRMVKGQSPQDWELRADNLAHAFHARSCRVRVRKPGRLELDFLHRDPLTHPVPVPALAESDDGVDLRKITVGRTETGKPWRIRLLGRHLLGVGVTGAGKGSLLWALVWALAPLIRTGRVRLVGIDPKGGMELGQAPEVFRRVVFDNGPDAVALLEEIAATVKERATRYRGAVRSWSAATGDPFIVLVVDELADVLAYQPDKQLRERANRAMQTITSQGRAPGVAVVGFVQDPRKEVVSFRHLFPTRVAMRLDEKAQVDMVLGDGAREQGAAAHEISEHTPGVAWTKDEGQREPLRARAFHITDTDLDTLASFAAGRLVRRAQVLPFPDQSMPWTERDAA